MLVGGGGLVTGAVLKECKTAVVERWWSCEERVLESGGGGRVVVCSERWTSRWWVRARVRSRCSVKVVGCR